MDAPIAGLTSVLIVAADSGDDLRIGVERVASSSAAVEIIVSDNASSDRSVDRLAAQFAGDARVRIVRNESNVGFGAGCNRAAAIARGDSLLILNPDCRIDPRTIAELRVVIDGDDSIGLVGATIVDESGRYEPASRRHDPLLRRALATKSGLQKVLRIEGANLSAQIPSTGIEDVDAVSGALMLIRRDVFERIGGFDEAYFLHCEDLDLCRRVRDAGLRVVCANAVRVVHLKGTSSRSRRVFVARHKHRGMWRWFTKFDPAARNPLLRGLVWCGIWTHFALQRAGFFVRGQR